MKRYLCLGRLAPKNNPVRRMHRDYDSSVRRRKHMRQKYNGSSVPTMGGFWFVFGFGGGRKYQRVGGVVRTTQTPFYLRFLLFGDLIPEFSGSHRGGQEGR